MAIEIKSSRLKVRLSERGEYYRGSRFDWSGFITDVTLDGQYNFCADESLIKGTGSGGRGLCNEFGIHDPIGYAEAKAGDGFPKLGIGILEKTDSDDYNFFKAYPITPFECETAAAESSVVFTIYSKDCNGYSVSYQKEIQAVDNGFKIKYYLKNTGSKAFQTTEYCHNFVSIDQKSIGPDYELAFSFVPVGKNMPEIFRLEDNRIHWRYIPENEFYWVVEGFENKADQFWELRDLKKGIGMRETANFPVQRIAIWGKEHVVSPEMFIHIVLKPGEEMRWQRTYTFFTL